MSIKIEINLHPEFGPVDAQLNDAMQALGYERRTPTLREIAVAAHDAGVELDFQTQPKGGSDGGSAASAPTTAPAARKRGEPSPGKKRRTAAEIAEDEAADAAEAGEQSNIRSGSDDRPDPDNPPAEDDEATAQQDAADEQAEHEESADLTLDDVKAIVNDYVAAYGMPAVQEDGPKIFKEALGNPPEGEAYWKFSLLPNDQDSLRKLVTVWKKAVELNPLKREKV